MAFYSDEYNTFVSIEPILEPFTGISDDNGLVEDTGWVILGAETGNRADKVVPKKEWVEDLVSVLKRKGKAVFMKNSMIPVWGEDIITQFPWDK